MLVCLCFIALLEGRGCVKSRIRWWLLIVVALSVSGFVFRLYGLDWDDGGNFHPDERQILFHVVALSWPRSWAQFLNPAASPLNPHFFAYGSFPMYLLAIVGHFLGYKLADPASFFPLTLVGRVLSALFDSGTVLLTGILAFVLVRRMREFDVLAGSVAMLATACMAFAPLDLQLSHFFTVDTILVFFILFTVLACVIYVTSDKPFLWICMIGLGYGLALATKFSAAPLIVPVFVACFLRWLRQRDISGSILALCLAILMTWLVFMIAQPYALLDFPEFAQQISEQSALASGALDYPYVRQFVGTIPYIYPLQNLVLWGMGVTLGVTALLGLCWLCIRTILRVWRREFDSWLVILSWVLVYGGYMGSLFTKYMRYMLPVYPFLAVIAASSLLIFVYKLQWSEYSFLVRLRGSVPFLRVALIVLVVGGTVFQGLALLNVYSEPDTRIQASEWIYQHIPAGSVITYEQWDDPLPFAIAGHSPTEYVQATYADSSGQTETGLDLYGDDTVQKAGQIAAMLAKVDAITMPTDRLDKSIPRSPARYPLTIHYYQLLFSGQLGFHLAAQFVVRPHLLGITLDDSNADESYSVFDHPHARIFVRDTPFPYTAQQLETKLLQGVHVPNE
jgi:hypothetical protein